MEAREGHSCGVAAESGAARFKRLATSADVAETRPCCYSDSSSPVSQASHGRSLDASAAPLARATTRHQDTASMGKEAAARVRLGGRGGQVTVLPDMSQVAAGKGTSGRLYGSEARSRNNASSDARGWSTSQALVPGTKKEEIKRA